MYTKMNQRQLLPVTLRELSRWHPSEYKNLIFSLCQIQLMHITELQFN